MQIKGAVPMKRRDSLRQSWINMDKLFIKKYRKFRHVKQLKGGA